MRLAILIGLLAIAACSPAEVDGGGGGEGADVTLDDAADPSLVIDSNGFASVNRTGSTRWTRFGDPQEGVSDWMSQLLGADYVWRSNEECPAGPMQFADFGDFTLNFQDEIFAGWSLSQTGDTMPSFTTMDGIGVGRSRSEIEATRVIEPFTDSTLGDEFTSGDLHMLLSGTGPDAQVLNMWAGTNCIFR